MKGAIRALSLFTIAPIRTHGELTRADAGAALRWLPVLGAKAGALAGLPMAAVLYWAHGSLFLGAVLAVVALVALTRALHFDGLADTVDGLASRAPAERALEIMRRSDVGPFGVLAVVLVVLVDVAAIASLDANTWRPVAALSVAAATGRLAVLHAAHEGVPAARAEGFGAYVAGSVSTPVALIETVAVLGFGIGMAAAVRASLLGWPLAQAGALVLCFALRLHAGHRIGGVTGDVFGALVEVGTAATLVGLAFS